MTREEAIKGLKSLVEVRRKYGDMQTMKYEIECLDMAIKALEQEPYEDVSDINDGNMDCISRQAVLDEMYRRKANGDVITAGFIKNLQPVTPQQKTGRWIHNKCDKCGASRPPLFDNYCPNCGNPKMQEVEDGNK